MIKMGKLFLKTESRLALRLMLIAAIVTAGYLMYEIRSDFQKIDLYVIELGSYFDLEYEVSTMKREYSPEQQVRIHASLDSVLFIDWFQTAEWLEELHDNGCPEGIEFKYELKEFRYPIENDSLLAHLPIQMFITVDSAYGMAAVLTLLEEVTLKTNPPLSIEGVELYGIGEGIRNGTINLQGWMLR